MCRRGEFARVYAARRFASDQLLVVHVIDNDLAWSRLGLSVGKRVGGAVQRNRIRRRIREAFRKNKDALPIGLDIVCVAKPGPEPAEVALAESLRALVVRAARRRSPLGPERKPESELQPERKPCARRPHRPIRSPDGNRPE